MSEQSADKTKMSLMDDGPILVAGEFQLTLPDGTIIPVEGNTVALCRCGASENKPFCDGAHKKIGFVSGRPKSDS
jgi:CDGSH-type Zn-finger protein